MCSVDRNGNDGINTQNASLEYQEQWKQNASNALKMSLVLLCDQFGFSLFSVVGFAFWNGLLLLLLPPTVFNSNRDHTKKKHTQTHKRYTNKIFIHICFSSSSLHEICITMNFILLQRSGQATSVNIWHEKTNSSKGAAHGWEMPKEYTCI